MQIHLWPELGEIAFTGMGHNVSSTFRDLDLRLFDVISMLQALQAHTWPNFGKASSNVYEDIVFTLFSSSFPAVTLTFDLWCKKLISITNPIHLWPKLSEIPFIGFWDIVFTRVWGHCLLWPWPLIFWPQNLNQHIYMNPNTSVSKIGWHSLHWFCDMVFTSFFGTHRRTHALTHRRSDPNAVCLQQGRPSP